MTTWILDLETVALPGAEAWHDPILPDTSPVLPDARLTDPIKIAASIEKKTREREEAHAAKLAARFDGFSTDPDCCRIALLGTADYKGMMIQTIIRTDDEERAVLERFWDAYRNASPRLVTFNGLAFDLPVLMRRSLWLGVPHPQLNLDRYRSEHPDLYQMLSCRGTVKAHALRFYRRRMGLPDDPTSGADIAALVAAGDWDAVRAHNRADLETTYTLAQRMGVLG